MGVHQNCQDLLKYLDLNNQKSYEKSKQDLEVLHHELRNANPSNAQMARYHAAIEILVSNYFSTEYPSPLMYFSANGQIDLVKDLLACSDTQVDEVFNHKVTKTESEWFGLSYTEKKVNGEKHNYTALLFAALAQQHQIAKLLIRHYANSQHEISEFIEIMDLVDAEKFPEMTLLLSHAKLNQTHHLSMDLINSESKAELEYLTRTQLRLGITKTQVLDCILNIYPDDQERAIEILEQANDIDEYRVPQNSLAEYMMKSQSLLGGIDQETLDKIEARHTQLAIPQCKPLRNTYLTVYMHAIAKTHEISGALQAHGPQSQAPEREIFRRFDI